MSRRASGLDPHVRDHLLHGLAPEPGLGFAVYTTAEGLLSAIVVAPRGSVHDLELLCRHPDAVVWVAPQWVTRTGKVWRGRGWFPLTADEWSRLCESNVHRIFLSDCTTRRQCDLVVALYDMLERDVIAR